MHIDLQLEPIFQDNYLKVEVDKNVKYIYLEWHNTPTDEDFRQSFHKAASISLELKCEYWLSDARNIPYLDFANQNWILRVMTPLLMASPLKKYARLSTRESIGLLDIHRIYSILESQPDMNKRTKFEVFTEREAALDWLFSDYVEEQPPIGVS